MKPAKTVECILVFVSLLFVGALALAGCGSNNSNAKQAAGLSDSEPFVASAIPGPRDQAEGTTTIAGDVTQVRNATASFDVEATDPRLSGTFDVIFNYDQAADGSAVMWGTWKLTNDNGTWVCDSTRGAFDQAGRTFTVGLGKGTGAYEGLVSLWQWYWPLSRSGSTGLPEGGLPIIAVSGWVQDAQ